jgi:hypothetical protein
MANGNHTFRPTAVKENLATTIRTRSPKVVATLTHRLLHHRSAAKARSQRITTPPRDSREAVWVERAGAGALDVNAKANWDWTPLHSAVEAGRKENGRRKKLQNGLRKQEWRAFLPAARLMISGVFVFRIYHRQEITLSLTWHEHDRSISSHPTPTPDSREAVWWSEQPTRLQSSW